VLTSLAPDSTSRDPFAVEALRDAPAAPIDDLEPLAKDCPEDLPCRVADADLWFAETPAMLEQAKALCSACPARLACLAGALERREPWGVWGGEIFERGSIIARKRPRGRPRKDDATRADEVAA
jgi:WhiB family transcriptional regulator, redox-sensing transcriptional regulator